MSDDARLGCLICAKHRGEGPLAGGVLVWEDQHSLVFHRPTDETGTAVLGYLFVETRRHVPYLADLSDDEAAAIGRTVRWAAFGVRTELNADFVFSAIAGMGQAHFHQHVFARHQGTPAAFDWMTGHQWPGAPRGEMSAIADLCGRLRVYLGQRAENVRR